MFEGAAEGAPLAAPASAHGGEGCHMAFAGPPHPHEPHGEYYLALVGDVPALGCWDPAQVGGGRGSEGWSEWRGVVP